jgi:hypothetical protein
MGCLSRSSYAEYTETIATHFAEAAPTAQLILATLPSGSAYPANPAAEMQRLADHETEPRLKGKVCKKIKTMERQPYLFWMQIDHILSKYII